VCLGDCFEYAERADRANRRWKRAFWRGVRAGVRPAGRVVRAFLVVHARTDGPTVAAGDTDTRFQQTR
jgi:hypothetical protein